MTPELSQSEAPAPGPQPRELDLFSFALLLLRNAKFILGCGLVAFLAMLVLMLTTKPRFASTAVMVVPQGNITSSRLQQQLSLSTIDLLGGGYELYGDILKSRAVEDRLIADYNLQKVYGSRDRGDAENTLASLTKVETQREGIVRVTVQDTNAQRAADLANDYFTQLELLNRKLVLDSVKQERVYLEGELSAEKDRLADAEVALKQVQENTSGVSPESEASAGLSALESTRAQLRADQIRLDSLLTGETEENPEVIRLRSQIAGLNAQVEDLQRGAPSTSTGTPTTQLPAQMVEYTRRLRDVKFHEELYNLLEKQFEEAKQQEAKTPSIVQVLDAGVPSFHKSWPPRTYYCLGAGVLGTLAGIFLVVFRAFTRAYTNNPSNAEKLSQLKALYRRKTSSRQGSQP